MGQPEQRLTKATPAVYVFGEYTLDLHRGFLLRGAEEVKLRPKSFEALKYLVVNRGRLIDKTELMRVLWPDTFVSDDSLAHCLMEARKALGAGQQFIRTVPGRGYVFDSLDTQPQQKQVRRRTTLLRSLLAIVAIIAGMIAIVTLYRRHANLKAAYACVQRAQEMARTERFFEAYDLASIALKYYSDEPALARLMPLISCRLSVTTKPAGARVYLQRFQPDQSGRFPRRQFIGTTPIDGHLVPRGDYLLALEKEGYAGFRRTISSALTVSRQLTEKPSPMIEISVDHNLVEVSKAQKRMAFIPGGEYRLVGWGKPTNQAVRLSDYWIDQFEVTNRDYKDFVDSGGYSQQLQRPEMAVKFRDRTGLAAPRGWSGGSYPETKAEYPVTGITWYEADAYCRFRGKRLPTAFEWEKAARDGASVVYGMAMPWGLVQGEIDRLRANFNSGGPVPVESCAFGMSPYGCYHMAGNVAEWALNAHGNGFLVAGGAWDGPLYLFGDYGTYPASYTSETLGFRCACAAGNAGGADQERNRLAPPAVPTYQPSTERNFRIWRRYYHYDKVPLDAKIVERQDTPEWRRDKITYLGAKDRQVIAYLFLPKNAKPPFQVFQYTPGAMVFFGFPVTDAVHRRLAPHIRYGRAVFLVALDGYAERKWPAGQTIPRGTSVRFRDLMADWTIDLQRGVDYLQTRSDIDAGKIAFGNVSTAFDGLIFAAIESRYRSIVLLAAGVDADWAKWIPEANPINFAPHIRAPKLMLSGRYDEAFSFRTQIEPLFRLLSEPKRMHVFEGGHLPPLEISAPVINKWLDETLGPVRR